LAGAFGWDYLTIRFSFFMLFNFLLFFKINMAIYLHLPVYKASYDLLIEIFGAIKDFNREYKYTLGENIKREAIEMVTDIYRANSSFSKASHIEKAREKIETVRIFFRLTMDLRQVNLKRFVEINEKIENISKQLTAWERSQK